MKAKRKRVTMLVTVSVPASMTARDARREVRELISFQRNYSADPDDIIVRRVLSRRGTKAFTGGEGPEASHPYSDAYETP